MMRRCFFLALAICFSSPAFGQANEEKRFGHSSHGPAFDSGLRTKPWLMKNIGETHFPVTSKNKEVQKWFDQGNTLLHNFWFEEAERSFRWAAKLDPDCAMAYWGMAAAGYNWFGSSASPRLKRFRDFLDEAVKRKDKASPRERMYIDTWDAAFPRSGNANRDQVLMKGLKDILIAYPNDLEAKALLALYSIHSTPAAENEKVITEVLARDPRHPGAHHYRIHNWDEEKPLDGMASCHVYGKYAPGAGHALHMPGHIYSKIGMWHEAGIAMDSATRSELKYLRERFGLPYELWNYSHNRNYLSYIQEQLGMASAAIQGARDLLACPLDPDHNREDYFQVYQQGQIALARALLKYERWYELLKPGTFTWRPNNNQDKTMALFIEANALAGVGRVFEAREKVEAVRKLVSTRNSADMYLLELTDGRVFAAEGKFADAEAELIKAANREQKLRDGRMVASDPPVDPYLSHRILGDFYLARKDHSKAIAAYEQALKNEPDDGFSLSGLARAHHAAGNKERATHFYGRLLYVWSNADKDLKWLQEAHALGLKSAPIAVTPAKEIRYEPAKLEHFGPSNWSPYPAPKLDCRDANGKRVQLEDFRGKNVVLVFYLSDECVHCVEQLVKINGRADEFKKENTVILAISAATPEQNRASQALGGLGITLLSDRNHENARRYHSYDDFEEIELHSTILLDEQGRLIWKRTGGAPFTDVDFLLKQIRR